MTQERSIELYGTNLNDDLAPGLRQGAFSIVLQPKILMANRRIGGAEILGRWHHPLFGQISPDAWVQMVKSQGMMREFTEWLVCQALQCMHLEMQLAINVCPSIFDHQLIDFIAEKFACARVSPQMLELELTETIKPECLSTLAKAVYYARSLGFHVALDDFGMGYNSMASMMYLSVNTIKIDRSIVQNVMCNHSASRICGMLIALAHEIDARVVCEGVETEELYDILYDMGADSVQGYLFGAPMPLDFAALYMNNHVQRHSKIISVNY